MTIPKSEIRRRAFRARRLQSHAARLSRLAVEQLVNLPEYQQANVALWYVSCRSELKTQWWLQTEPRDNDNRSIIVPFCRHDEGGDQQLGLWRLESFNELIVGSWKILEPPPTRWQEQGKLVLPGELDVVVVPGVAFSRQGARLGNGQGYYDRLLRHVRPDCALLGICYECQIMNEWQLDGHDIRMHKVVTESAIYDCAVGHQ